MNRKIVRLLNGVELCLECTMTTMNRSIKSILVEENKDLILIQKIKGRTPIHLLYKKKKLLILHHL